MVTYEDGFTGEMCIVLIDATSNHAGAHPGGPQAAACACLAVPALHPRPHTPPRRSVRWFLAGRRLRIPLRCLLGALPAAEGLAELSAGSAERSEGTKAALCRAGPARSAPPRVPGPGQAALCSASPRARLGKGSGPALPLRLLWSVGLQQFSVNHRLDWINVSAVTSSLGSSVMALTSHVLLKCSHFWRDIHDITVSPKGKVFRSSSTAVVNRD